MKTRRSFFASFAAACSALIIGGKATEKDDWGNPQGPAYVMSVPDGMFFVADTDVQKVEMRLYDFADVVRTWPKGQYHEFEALRKSRLKRGMMRSGLLTQWFPTNDPVIEIDKTFDMSAMWNGFRWLDGNSDEARKIFDELCPPTPPEPRIKTRVKFVPAAAYGTMKKTTVETWTPDPVRDEGMTFPDKVETIKISDGSKYHNIESAEGAAIYAKEYAKTIEWEKAWNERVAIDDQPDEGVVVTFKREKV